MKLKFLFILNCIAIMLFAQEATDHIKDGNKQYREGTMEAAVSAYSKVTNGPYKYVALVNKGNALYRLKKYDEAIATYNAAAVTNNNDIALRSSAFYNAGVVYSNQKKTDESIAAYKNALRLNSNDMQARENLQKALLEKKQQSSGGGGGQNKQEPQNQSSKINQSEAQKQLDKLEQKEKNTQQRVSENKSQFSNSNEKDW